MSGVEWTAASDPAAACRAMAARLQDPADPINTYQPTPLLGPIHPYQYRILQEILGKPGEPLTQQEVLDWVYRTLLGVEP